MTQHESNRIHCADSISVIIEFHTTVYIKVYIVFIIERNRDAVSIIAITGILEHLDEVVHGDGDKELVI